MHRKLQKISGSLFVSLPSGWIKGSGLKKGSKVSLQMMTDGSLKLMGKGIPEGRRRLVLKKTDFLSRRLLSAYLAGFDEVVVSNTSKFQECLDFSKKVKGMEVHLEEKQLVVEIMLRKKPVDQVFGRMAMLVSSMMKRSADLDELEGEMNITYLYLV